MQGFDEQFIASVRVSDAKIFAQGGIKQISALLNNAKVAGGIIVKCTGWEKGGVVRRMWRIVRYA